MAFSAPSTSLRPRVHSADGGSSCRSPRRITETYHQLQPSSDIPRTYSGLFGAGVGTGDPPSIPTDFSNRESEASARRGNSVVRLRSRAATEPSSPSSLFLSPPSKTRERCRSRDHHHHDHHRHPPAYSQHYRAGSDLLPFELSRNRNTDWISAGGPPLLLTYLSLILVFLLTALAFLDPRSSWTATNFIHGAATMVYLHWIKGNPADYMDGTQGEMNAMTLWEQIVSRPAVELHSCDKKATPDESEVGGSTGGGGRGCALTASVLCVVPTLLAHGACHFADYNPRHVLANVAAWAIVLVPKMPFMNGVRILGINRTAGIDDDGALFDTEGTETEEEGESWDETSNDERVSMSGDGKESKKGL